MNSKQPQGLWIFSAVNSRDITQALERLKARGRETDITPEEMCDEMGISRDRAQWLPAQEERKSMTIHPTGTPLSRVAKGEAIADLPFPTSGSVVTLIHADDSTYPYTPSFQAYPSPEFVRFLTEQDGRMVHVWKRTK